MNENTSQNKKIYFNKDVILKYNQTKKSSNFYLLHILFYPNNDMKEIDKFKNQIITNYFDKNKIYEENWSEDIFPKPLKRLEKCYRWKFKGYINSSVMDKLRKELKLNLLVFRFLIIKLNIKKNKINNE